MPSNVLSISKGSSLLRCGFGRNISASAAWGPRDVLIDDIASQWYLPVMIRLYPAWLSVRNLASRLLGWPYSGPAIEVTDVVTPSQDRVVRIPRQQGIEAFGIIGTNLGRTGPVTLIPKFPEGLELVATVCPTEPEKWHCLESPKPSVTVPFGHGSKPTFTVFVRRRGRAASKPLIARVEVLFLNEHGRLCGVTHVGVQTQ